MGQAKQPAIRLRGLFEVTLDGQRVAQSLPGRQGRLIVAYLACNRGRSVTRDELIDLSSVSTYGVVANLLSRRDEVEGAAIAIERANELLPRLNEAYWWLIIETRIRLAPPLILLGRRVEAASRLKEAAALLAGRDDTGILPDWHAEASRKLHDHRSQRPERLNHTEPADSAPARDEHDAARDPARIVPLRAAAD